MLVKGVNEVLLFGVGEGERAQIKSDFGSTEGNGGY
jgi:hypothetical protein